MIETLVFLAIAGVLVVAVLYDLRERDDWVLPREWDGTDQAHRMDALTIRRINDLYAATRPLTVRERLTFRANETIIGVRNEAIEVRQRVDDIDPISWAAIVGVLLLLVAVVIWMGA